MILLAGNVTLPGMYTIPLGGLLVLAWARLARTPWADIGFAAPRSWPLTITSGVLLGIALKLIMKAVVMPLAGASPINHAYAFLTGNRALLPGAFSTMLAAGFGEETVFRGYLFERWRKAFGWSARARIAAVLATSVLFGLAHYAGQGPDGVVQALFTGAIFGAIAATTGRIWLVMIAHACFDLTALYLIYNGLETRVAHLLF